MPKRFLLEPSPERLRRSALSRRERALFMNRREFLLLRPGTENRSAEISCERLYMRHLDSQIDGTTAQFLENLARDLQDIDILRLSEGEWLASEELKQQLEPIFTSFRARGGKIELA